MSEAYSVTSARADFGNLVRRVSDNRERITIARLGRVE